jgi:hypothetical protein
MPGSFDASVFIGGRGLSSDVHDPVQFVEGWARGVRARGAGSSLGSSFIIKKIIKKIIKIFINTLNT